MVDKGVEMTILVIVYRWWRQIFLSELAFRCPDRDLRLGE